MNRSFLLLAMAGMAMASAGGLDEFERAMPRKRRSERKNKFSLTEGEIEHMRMMTPKQKKQWLRDRNKKPAKFP